MDDTFESNKDIQPIKRYESENHLQIQSNTTDLSTNTTKSSLLSSSAESRSKRETKRKLLPILCG